MENVEVAKRDISDRGIRYGIISTGHGGNRIGEQFYKLGYPVVAINTAKQDLAFIDMPANNKLFLDFALGGVGKDATLGLQAIEHYEKDIMQLMHDMFKDIDVSLKRTKDGLKRFEELLAQVNVNISQAVLEYQKAHKR